jgi:hypothetical protein
MTNISLLATNLNDSALANKNFNSDKFNIYAPNDVNLINDFGMISDSNRITDVNNIETAPGKNANPNNANQNAVMASTTTTETLNVANANDAISSQHMFSHFTNRFDEEDDYLLAPSDIIEYKYGNGDDIGSFLNLNEKTAGHINLMMNTQKENNFSSFYQKNNAVQHSPDFNLLLNKSTKTGNKSIKINSSLGDNNLNNIDEQSFQIVTSAPMNQEPKNRPSNANNGNSNNEVTQEK